MTRDEFIQDMKKGWEKLGYTSGAFYADNVGPLLAKYASQATRACAIGAAAAAAGWHPHDYVYQLPGDMWDKIASASNMAGSKEAAIAAIEALEWEDTK